MTAARAALKRKKQHEHTLDQTLAQISTLEQQIYSIEAANINRETLAAMEKAGQAMKQIHGKLNIDVVDQTMYAYIPHIPLDIDILTFGVQGGTQRATRIGRRDRKCNHKRTSWRDD